MLPRRRQSTSASSAVAMAWRFDRCRIDVDHYLDTTGFLVWLSVIDM
jgi:hypothetical protein